MSQLKRFGLFIWAVLSFILLFSVCIMRLPEAKGATTPYIRQVGDNRYFACLDGLVVVTVGTSTFYYHTTQSGAHPVRCDNFELL